MCRAIVGFKLSIQQVEAKFKLSQNKSLNNRQGVIDGLTRLQTAEASAMIQLLTDNN
jgi:transcriptional regulator